MIHATRTLSEDSNCGEDEMNGLITRLSNMTPEQKALVVLGGVAVLATGGAVAYAAATSEALFVAYGGFTLATGGAAVAAARSIR